MRLPIAVSLSVLVVGATVDGRPALVVERPAIDPMATVVAVELEGDHVEP